MELHEPYNLRILGKICRNINNTSKMLHCGAITTSGMKWMDLWVGCGANRSKDFKST